MLGAAPRVEAEMAIAVGRGLPVWFETRGVRACYGDGGASLVTDALLSLLHTWVGLFGDLMRS